MSTELPQTAAPSGNGSLNRQGGTVASMTLLSRITGLVRDMVLSYFFGATQVADAFFVAFRIPNFFRRLFAEGAFSQAFVPVLAAFRQRGDRDELIRFVRVMSGWFAGALVLVCLLGVLGAQWLVVVFAPGFWGDPVRSALATDMLRITFPYLGFISLTAFAGALLNAHQRFAIPAFTPVLLNLCLIGAALFAAPAFDEPVMALAWGVLAAGMGQLLFQLPSLRRIEMLHMPKLERRHEGVYRVGVLLVPAVFAASVSQVNALVDTILASFLITGSISWLYYADRLMELPVGLVAVALATVLLPALSRAHAADDRHSFVQALNWGMRMGLLLGIPAAAALYVLSVPLTATIFMRGAMTGLDTAMAALALQAFAVGLPALVLAKILAPGFFAQQDTRTPFRIALVSVGVNCAGNLALFSWLGHVGLALATSAAALTQAGLLLRGLMLRDQYRPDAALARFALKVVVATAVMVAVLLWFSAPEAAWMAMGEWARVGQTALLCGSGLAVYLVALLVLGIRPAELRHR